MFRTGLLAGSLTTAILMLTMAFASPVAVQDDQRPDRSPSAGDVKEFTGLIVDLYHYLDRENYQINEHDDADVAGEYTGGPVGLLTSEEGMIRTRTELRVIVYASREDAEKLRDKAGRMVGQRVRVVGLECSRDGVTAIAAKNLSEARPSNRRPE